MDIEIVNTILRLCFEQQTCLFEVPVLCDYCLGQRLCPNARYVLPSIKNYMEIFRISRDQNRIEIFMPFEICRNNFLDGLCQTNGELCSNLHVCYDYFYNNSCRRLINCPYPHLLSERYHKKILGTLNNLDFDLLTKAFRVYCQSRRHLFNSNSSGGSSTRIQQQQATPSSSSVNNSTNNWRLPVTPQISRNTSWKTNNRTVLTSRILPTQQPPLIQTITQLPDKGLQICWKPLKHIQSHFIEVVFSNPSKSGGGPIGTHTIYQHLGIAQIFYQTPEIIDRILQHQSIKFQSFTFTTRLLQRTIDLRHICFVNIPLESMHLPLYIDTVSMPYKKHRFEYYYHDQQTIVVEYKEDIDFLKISSNVRNHPECNGLPIKCIQLYHPETLFLEYDQDYSESDIETFFPNQRIFHIKTYSFCAFVHFYSHDDLLRSIKISFDHPIKVTPVYIDIHTQHHLDNYLQQRQLELQSKSAPLINGTTTEEPVSPIRKLDPSPEPVPSIRDEQQPEISTEPKSPIQEEISPPVLPLESVVSTSEIPPSVELNDSDNDHENVENNEFNENDLAASEDDFDDIASDFDNDDLFLDEFVDNNGDMEFLRSAAKNLMSSLAEMEAASENMNTIDAPHSLLYADDYVVTIKSRRFALAFLDYTQFRVEKQRNPDKFRLLAALKKTANGNNHNSHTSTNSKKRIDNKQRDETPSPTPFIEPDLLATIETKSNKKRRNKRNKKKKITSIENKDKPEPTVESVNEEEEEEDDNTIHVLNDQGLLNNQFSVQRLPHVYLDNDLKPCIVVAGEEHNEDNEAETGEHEIWHNIVAGGKPVPVPKKSKKKKQFKDEKSKIIPVEQTPITPNPIHTHLSTDSNSLIIPLDCRGFVHQVKLYEAFRLRLRRSFPSINIRFQPETYIMMIDGNIKSNVQQCLNYLRVLPSWKRFIPITYHNFPSTTITNIIRMQQSTAQIKLDQHANYDRIFRSTYRLIDYQLKQQYNQQQCIYCRRWKKQFRITYLEFPSDKQSIEELNQAIQQRVIQLFTTRFTYIALALSTDLMTTKRWKEFFNNISKHKEVNQTILIRKINNIIQVYGLHAHVQQIQTLITKFLDANRYEVDVIETEQASGIYSLFKKDFQDMEKIDIFREAELRFVYRNRRHVLLVQCFQEKFELVKSRIEKLRSHLSSIIYPVKSSVLSRYYSKSLEIQNIAKASSCIITIEQRHDSTRTNGDYFIDLKILGRSPERAQKLIKEFEEQQYSTGKILNNDIHLFTENELKQLQNECSTCNVSYTIDQTNNSIELEGLSADFIRIEKLIQDLCLFAARRALDHLQYSTQWIYHDPSTHKPVAFTETIKRELEACFTRKQKGLINIRDHTGLIRTFDLDKMIEIVHSHNPNTSPIIMKIERRDFQNPQSFPLPSHWTPMTKPWDRIFLGRHDNITEWKTNNEIQKILKLPYMLPESWITDIYRVQNPRMFQQYMAYKENFATRSQDVERILYRLAQVNLIDDMCAHGFNRSHTDAAFSAYGLGCHFYCKAIDIDRTATLLAQNLQPTSIMLQQQTPAKAPVRFLFICKVLVGRYTRGDASMKTCPPGYDSLVDNIVSPEIFVTHQDAQVLPEYLIAYQSAIF